MWSMFWSYCDWIPINIIAVIVQHCVSYRASTRQSSIGFYDYADYNEAVGAAPIDCWSRLTVSEISVENTEEVQRLLIR